MKYIKYATIVLVLLLTNLNIALSQVPPPAKDTWLYKILTKKNVEYVQDILIEKSKVARATAELSAISVKKTQSPCGFCANHFSSILEKKSIEPLGSGISLNQHQGQLKYLSKATNNDVLMLRADSANELGEFITSNLGSGDHALLDAEVALPDGEIAQHQVNVINIGGEYQVYDVQYIDGGEMPIPLDDFLGGKIPDSFGYQVAQIAQNEDSQFIVTFNVRSNRSYIFSKKNRLYYLDETSPPDYLSAIEIDTQMSSKDLTKHISRYKAKSSCTIL